MSAIRSTLIDRVHDLIASGDVEGAKSLQNSAVRKQLARRKKGARMNLRELKVSKAAIDRAERGDGG